ncbi:hypothetical protein [Clostridium sp. SM-530-WT-3G]|uniref:hypothetical protein n=1 Tax=Clostridium sp. SM-530-WT-3G TaxID=2725303 RepID=UPI00145CA9F5|nr:hypothetical protein [Clostridium sp. SM-530-WT-3G]NME83938.1 hypothetical protein [Clostridium sp. SM-530-WT-3G]
MDFAKYHSQIIKDIDHYITRTKIGNVLKAEQKEVTIENKKINVLSMIIQLKKNELLRIDGKNNEYNFTISLNGNDVYSAPKCNFRDNTFREAVKDSDEYMNFINCFENINKIFKKKRKK